MSLVMLKKTAGNRRKPLKKKMEGLTVVAPTGSVRELSGMFYRKGRKPVSIEEMDAAIAKGASRSMSRAR
jgi:hypothetical protein